MYIFMQKTLKPEQKLPLLESGGMKLKLGTLFIYQGN